jgi:predicted AlkP superfamily phosphohydrolase/phosphomutase
MLIVLDGCDRDVATALAATGRMPHLARLLEDAASVPTVAPRAGLFVSAIWPTMFTARRPEHHGYTCWIAIEPSTYANRGTSPHEAEGAPFWEHLTHAGLRSALIDVPHSWPSPDHDGVMICEWSGHDRHFGLHSWPPDEAGRLVARHGLHPVNGLEHNQVRQFAPCDWLHGGPHRHRTADELTTMRDLLLRGIETKTAASLEYLREDDWDLFVSVVGETHCSGHQFWHLHDQTHERFDRELNRRIGDPLTDIYARADAFLGAHLDAVADDTNVFVLLSHGMGPHHGGNHLLDVVLHRLAEHHEHGFARGRSAVRGAKRAWATLPEDARRRATAVAAGLANRRDVARTEPTDVLPARADRPWYAVPNNDVGGALRLNVLGREHAGTVPTSEVDATLDWLSTALRELVHPATGRPVVRDIVRGSEAFPAPSHPDHFADLYLDWDMTALVDTVYSPRSGIVHAEYRHVRTGDHLPHGLLLARGPAVHPTRGFAGQAPVPIEDIAPTVAATLAVELPGVDGRPRTELVGARAVP